MACLHIHPCHMHPMHPTTTPAPCLSSMHAAKEATADVRQRAAEAGEAAKQRAGELTEQGGWGMAGDEAIGPEHGHGHVSKPMYRRRALT